MINRSLISLAVCVSALGGLIVLMAPLQVSATEEQAIIVTIKLRSPGMGSTEERNRTFALEDQLSLAIKKSLSDCLSFTCFFEPAEIAVLLSHSDSQ